MLCVCNIFVSLVKSTQIFLREGKPILLNCTLLFSLSLSSYLFLCFSLQQSEPIIVKLRVISQIFPALDLPFFFSISSSFQFTQLIYTFQIFPHLSVICFISLSSKKGRVCCSQSLQLINSN